MLNWQDETYHAAMYIFSSADFLLFFVFQACTHVQHEAPFFLTSEGTPKLKLYLQSRRWRGCLMFRIMENVKRGKRRRGRKDKIQVWTPFPPLLPSPISNSITALLNSFCLDFNTILPYWTIHVLDPVQEKRNYKILRFIWNRSLKEDDVTIWNRGLSG